MDDFFDDNDFIDETGETEVETPLSVLNRDGVIEPPHYPIDIHDDSGYQKNVVPDLKNEINQELKSASESNPEINILFVGTSHLPPFPLFDSESVEQVVADPLLKLDSIYGHPENDIKLWHQQTYPDTCAIVSQEFVIESFINVDLDEDQLIDMAIKKGYYLPGGGTLPYDVGNIIEDFGIPVERSEGNSFEDLAEKLRNNQKIIVSLDANEIWNNSESEQLNDLFFMPEANHAVEVIGYNDDNQTIILNDPGHPNGQGLEVALSDFSQAWKDSNNFMMYSKNPAPVA